MTDPVTQKNTNQVDDVLQGYLDQLLVTATEPLAVVDNAKPAQSAHLSTPERVATALIKQQPLSQAAEQTLQPEVAPLAVTEIVSETEPRVKAFADDKPQSLSRTLTLPQQEIPPAAAPEPFEAPEPVEAVTTVDTPAIEQQLAIEQTAKSELDWRSSQGVECLIFKVAGLKLAIPLSLLGGVHNASDKITPLFGQANWSLGVWQSDEQKLTIVDSAQLIMPERGINLTEQGFGYVIQLDRSPWALACQEICDTITLVHDSIKWRGDNSKRPWLAGTVIDQMCALIDGPNLMDMLEQNTPLRLNFPFKKNFKSAGTLCALIYS